MKRNKDEDKEDIVTSSNAIVNNNNNNSKLNNNASPNNNNNTSSGSGSGINIINDANGANGSTPGTVRTTGRVKKPKLVYDPSDNYISRGARNSLTTTAPATTAIMPSPTTQSQPSSPSAASQNLNAAASQSQSLPSSQSSLQTTQVSDGSVSPSANTSANDETTEAAVVSIPTVEQQRNFDTCLKCGKSEIKRGSGYKSNFLTCKTCTMKWHFSCLPLTFEILSNARKKYKCEKCRRCQLCMPAKNGDKIKNFIMCSVCVTVYHLDCHWPAVVPSMLTDTKWKCYSCDPNYNMLADGDDALKGGLPPRKSKPGRKKRVTSNPALGNAKKKTCKELTTNNNSNIDANSSGSNTSASGSAALSKQDDDQQPTESTDTNNLLSPKKEIQVPSPSPIDSTVSPVPTPVPNLIDDKENEESKATEEPSEMDADSPAVKNWTVDDVVAYIHKFYPRESNSFKTQEIDGAALLVLTRHDIIDRFGLKLGPALRVYELVLGLQNSADDVTLGWCD